jgi:hypothetical protein
MCRPVRQAVRRQRIHAQAETIAPVVLVALLVATRTASAALAGLRAGTRAFAVPVGLPAATRIAPAVPVVRVDLPAVTATITDAVKAAMTAAAMGHQSASQAEKGVTNDAT